MSEASETGKVEWLRDMDESQFFDDSELPNSDKRRSNPHSQILN